MKNITGASQAVERQYASGLTTRFCWQWPTSYPQFLVLGLQRCAATLVLMKIFHQHDVGFSFDLGKENSTGVWRNVECGYPVVESFFHGRDS
jgi:hypothetical protein